MCVAEWSLLAAQATVRYSLCLAVRSLMHSTAWEECSVVIVVMHVGVITCSPA